MPGHECYHCKQWIDEGEAHDCWTTTEQALTQDLSEDLREAWERLRDATRELGEQRIYASDTSIMFSRKICHAFVRPKRNLLELCVFLGRTVRDPRVRRADRRRRRSSRTSSTSPIATRSSRRSPTGCARPTSCRTRRSEADGRREGRTEARRDADREAGCEAGPDARREASLEARVTRHGAAGGGSGEAPC